MAETNSARTERTFGKLVRHIREGTLFHAVLRKVGLARPGTVDPDRYRGDTAKTYLKKRLEQDHWHKEQAIMRELLRDVPDGSSVLDVPFGTGRFVDMYLEKGMTIRGIDISEDMLAVAREELGQSYDRCQIDLGSADSLPHADHSFDLVVCFRFFGLIPLAMARRVLSEIERVSRDKVIIPVPIRKSTAPYLGPLKHDELVQGRLDEQELHALFSEFGFSVVDERLIREREDVLSIVFVLRRSSTANA